MNKKLISAVLSATMLFSSVSVFADQLYESPIDDELVITNDITISNDKLVTPTSTPTTEPTATPEVVSETTPIIKPEITPTSEPAATSEPIATIAPVIDSEIPVSADIDTTIVETETKEIEQTEKEMEIKIPTFEYEPTYFDNIDMFAGEQYVGSASGIFSKTSGYTIEYDVDYDMGQLTFYVSDVKSGYSPTLSTQGITSEGRKVITGSHSYGKVQYVFVSEGFESIGGGFFYDWADMNYIKLPNSLKTIGSDAFKDCGLQTVDISNKSDLETIGDRAFLACNSLSNYSIGNKVKEIGEEAFKDCTSMNVFKVPEGVTEIKEKTFAGCGDNLANVYIPSTVTSIARNAFLDTSTDVYINNYEQPLPYKYQEPWGTTGNVYWLRNITVGDVGGPYYYMGNESIKPGIKITDSNWQTSETYTLIEGKDYTIDYVNNNAPGTATMYVHLLGVYANYNDGLITKTFTILDGRLKDASVTGISDFTYDGNVHKPNITVSINDDVLIEGKDYKYDVFMAGTNTLVANPTDAHTYDIVLTGLGDFAGGDNYTTQYTIYQRSISNVEISNIPSYSYTGDAIEPKPTLSLQGKTLQEDKDYILKWNNSVGPGNASVTIIGMGNFTSWTEKYYLIEGTGENNYKIEYIGEPLEYNYGQFPGINFNDVVISPAYKGSYELYFDYYNSVGHNDGHMVQNVKLYRNGELVYSTDELYTTNTSYNCLGIEYKSNGEYGICFTNVFDFTDNMGDMFTFIELKNYNDGSLNNYKTWTINYNELNLWADHYPNSKSDYTDLYLRFKDDNDEYVEVSMDDISQIKDMGYTFNAGDVIEVMFPSWNSDYVSPDYGFSREFSSKHDFVAVSLVIQPIDINIANLYFESQYGLGKNNQEAKYTGEKLTLTSPYYIVAFTGNGDSSDYQDVFDVRYENTTNIGTGKMIFTDPTGNFIGEYIVPLKISSIDVSDTNSFVTTNSSYTYTGSEIKPEISNMTVTYYGTTLSVKKGIDYEITGYKNNINAGTGYITIKGIEGSKIVGTVDVPFTITPADISNVSAHAVGEPIMYKGSPLTPEIYGTYNGINVVSGTDFTVTGYSNNDVNGGTGIATIQGKGNFTGTKDVEFAIKPFGDGGWDNIYDISNAIVTFPETYTYTGSAIEAKPVVTYDFGIRNVPVATLVEGTDYELSYINNINASDEATVILTGKGNFINEKRDYFTISPASLDDVDFENISDQPLNPDGVEPAIIASYNDNPLVKGSDFTVVYSNNKELGNATAAVTGTGNFTGEKSVPFSITSATISADNTTMAEIEPIIYNTKPQEPKPEVKFGNRVLTEGVDFRFEYANNVNAGTADIKVVGIGSFDGSIDGHFTIKRKDGSKFTYYIIFFDDDEE